MFYGWVMLAVAFVAQFVAMGCVFQSFAVFLAPLAEEFAVGRAQASLVPVTLSLSGVLIAALVGERRRRRGGVEPLIAIVRAWAPSLWLGVAAG